MAMRRWQLPAGMWDELESGAQLALVRAAARALGSPNPGSYLFRAALNGAVDAVRSEWGRSDASPSTGSARRPYLWDDEAWEMLALVDPSPGPADEVIAKEAVREILDGCPNERTREVVLRHAAGESVDEVAEKLGVTDSGVRHMLRSCHSAKEAKKMAVKGEAMTTREDEVLQLIADGLTNREIGDRLFVAEDTVKNHVKHLLAKLQARSRAHAVAIGLRAGTIA